MAEHGYEVVDVADATYAEGVRWGCGWCQKLDRTPVECYIWICSLRHVHHRCYGCHSAQLMGMAGTTCSEALPWRHPLMREGDKHVSELRKVRRSLKPGPGPLAEDGNGLNMGSELEHGSIWQRQDVSKHEALQAAPHRAPPRPKSNLQPLRDERSDAGDDLWPLSFKTFGEAQSSSPQQPRSLRRSLARATRRGAKLGPRLETKLKHCPGVV